MESGEPARGLRSRRIVRRGPRLDRPEEGAGVSAASWLARVESLFVCKLVTESSASARGEALEGLEGGAPEWRSLASTLPLNRPHRCHSTGRLATLRNRSRLAYSTVYPTQPRSRRRTEAGPRVSTLRLVRKWWAPRRPLNSTTRPQTRAWQAQARRTSSEWQHASTVVRTLPLPVSLAAPAAARGLRHPTRQPLPLLRTTPTLAAQATRFGVLYTPAFALDRMSPAPSFCRRCVQAPVASGPGG